MPAIFRRLAISAAALLLSSGLAFAQSKVTLAIGGASCLCYLPTMLAHQLGEYKKAGVDVEVIQFKGGSEALKAVMGGSADVVSGYFDHTVNLAAKGQNLQSFVVYDRFPGFDGAEVSRRRGKGKGYFFRNWSSDTTLGPPSPVSAGSVCAGSAAATSAAISSTVVGASNCSRNCTDGS